MESLGTRLSRNIKESMEARGLTPESLSSKMHGKVPAKTISLILINHYDQVPLGQIEDVLHFLDWSPEGTISLKNDLIPVYHTDDFLSENQTYYGKWPPHSPRYRLRCPPLAEASHAYMIECGKSFMSGHIKPDGLVVVCPEQDLEEGDLVFVINSNKTVEIKRYDYPSQHRFFEERGERGILRKVLNEHAKNMIHKIVWVKR